MTWLLRNLYSRQEAIVRTGHGTMDWFKIGKGVRQSCILSPTLYYLQSGGDLVTKSCLTLVIPWTRAYQAPLFMGFPRQECWSGLPLPSPTILWPQSTPVCGHSLPFL